MRITESFKNAFKNDSDPLYTLRYVIIFAAIVGLVAQYLSYVNGLVLAYNDSGLHLDVARRIYDSRDPGIVNQIGVVWLPVPHLLLVPFVYFDYLWTTGIAACITGWVYYVMTAGFLYRIMRYVTKDNHSALFGILFFLLNPSILYLYTTAMTEPLFLLFICIIIYHFLRWFETENSGEIVRAGIAAALAVMTRYDAWPFTFAAFAVLFIVSIVYKKRNAFRNILYFLGAPILTIAWYLWTNYSLRGDILAFQRGAYSSEYQVNLRYPEGAPFKYNFISTLDIINNAILMNAGYILIALAVIGLVMFLVKNKFSFYCLIPLLLLMFYPVNFYSVFLGQATIELPMTDPRGFFQSRYVIGVLPGLAVFLAYFFSRFRQANIKTTLFVMMFFIQNMWWYLLWPMGVAAIGEAETAYISSQRFRRISYFMASNYDGGNLLYDDFSIIFFSGTGIPINERIHEYSWDVGKKALESPARYVNWIMLNRTNSFDKVTPYMLGNKDFYDHFKLVYSDEGLEVYKKQ